MLTQNSRFPGTCANALESSLISFDEEFQSIALFKLSQREVQNLLSVRRYRFTPTVPKFFVKEHRSAMQSVDGSSKHFIFFRTNLIVALCLLNPRVLSVFLKLSQVWSFKVGDRLFLAWHEHVSQFACGFSATRARAREREELPLPNQRRFRRCLKIQSE